MILLSDIVKFYVLSDCLGDLSQSTLNQQPSVQGHYSSRMRILAVFALVGWAETVAQVATSGV